MAYALQLLLGDVINELQRARHELPLKLNDQATAVIRQLSPDRAPVDGIVQAADQAVFLQLVDEDRDVLGADVHADRERAQRPIAGVAQLHQDPSRAICEAMRIGFRLDEALDPGSAPADRRKDLELARVSRPSQVVEHAAGMAVVEAAGGVGSHTRLGSAGGFERSAGV